MIIDIMNERQFFYLYKQNKKKIIIFYRDGDIYSRDIIRYITKLSKIDIYIDILFLIIDFDVFYEISDIYNVYKPPYILFINGNKKERFIENNNLGLLEDYLDEFVLEK